MTEPSHLSRRDLLAGCSLGVGALYAGKAGPDRLPDGSLTPEQVAENEDFWRKVRAEFELDSNRVRVNLSAGNYNAPPRSVQAALLRTTRFINGMPNVNRSLAFGRTQRESLRARLAKHLGVSPNEIALTRGTTEAINIVSAGAKLERGDEVLTTNLDYASLRAAWRLRGLRDGVRLKEVAVPHPPDSPDQLVDALTKALTPKTRMLLVCHVTGVNGQIFPIREICEMAHARGVQVIVDGALAFGVMPLDLRAMGCDYYGTSLHKGMYAPTGTGLLYLRKDLISKVLPLFGAADPESSDVRKFEEIGTHPIAPMASVSAALDFHERIGTERIRARLHHLKQTWMKTLAGTPGVEFHTSPDANQSCAVANARIGPADPAAVWQHLYRKHGISCYYSKTPFPGIIVRFHVHSLRSEVEHCAHVLREVATQGIPGK